MNQIIFSPKAEESYLALLDYYLQFSVNFVLELEKLMDAKMEALKFSKNLCPTSRLFKGLRRCVLTEHISFVYLINKNSIEVVAFYDSRSNHPF